MACSLNFSNWVQDDSVKEYLGPGKKDAFMGLYLKKISAFFPPVIFYQIEGSAEASLDLIPRHEFPADLEHLQRLVCRGHKDDGRGIVGTCNGCPYRENALSALPEGGSDKLVRFQD